MLSLAIPNFLFIETHYDFQSSWIAPSPTMVSGLTVLSVGWFWLFGLQFIWLANPFYYLSLCFFCEGRWRAAIVLSGISIAIAIASTISC